METLIFTTVLAVLVAARLFFGKRAANFIASLPAEERARIKSCLSQSTY